MSEASTESPKWDRLTELMEMSEAIMQLSSNNEFRADGEALYVMKKLVTICHRRVVDYHEMDAQTLHAT